MKRDPRINPIAGDVLQGQAGGGRTRVEAVHADERCPGGAYVVYNHGNMRSIEGWRKVHASDRVVHVEPADDGFFTGDPFGPEAPEGAVADAAHEEDQP